MNGQAAERPVLVVGGRTTGLMMAAELSRHGASVRIVDLSPGIDPHARATVLHSRTLEILDELGVARGLIDIAQPLRGFVVYENGRLVGRSSEDDVESPFPHAVGLPQTQTERALELHLNRMGVEVERSTRLSAMREYQDGIHATLTKADGSEEIVDTPWLIGCDGAHSTVRHLTEQGFPGDADPYQYVVADVVVDGDLNPEDAVLFLSDEGELFFFILNEGRRFVVANLSKETVLAGPPSLAQIQEIVAQRSHSSFRLTDPRWLSSFHIHYRLAPHYRQGRTFLAGDAAHIHSLIGGQGMNTGIQDAHNLAWKLALVVRGVVDPAWLDSYEIERRSVAEDVIAATKAATEGSELFASLSTAKRAELLRHSFVPESEKWAARRHAEELDLDYQSSPICVEEANDFDGGLHAGVRALDAEPIIVDGRATTLFDALNGPKHRLILFANLDVQVDSLGLVDAIESAIADHEDWIDLFVVAEPNVKLATSVEFTRLEDPTGKLRERYAIKDEGLYLIRPDGYVAYRQSSLGSINEYLAKVP